MQQKLKPNDLCFIINAIRKQNIGRIVTTKECLGYYQKDGPYTWNNERWLTQDTGYLWVIEGNLDVLFGKSKQAVIPEHWLCKIEPLDELQEVFNVLEDEILGDVTA